MELETQKVVIYLGGKEKFTDFLSHIKKINNKYTCLNLHDYEEIISEKIIDVVYFEKLCIDDNKFEKLDYYCKNNHISLYEVVEGEASDQENYSADYEKIYFPITTKELSMSLHISNIYRDISNKLGLEKKRNEEIMIGLAHSNVRVILLSDALQKLRVSENIILKKDGFLVYICDFLNSIKNMTSAESTFFIIYGNGGGISQLYDFNGLIIDTEGFSELKSLAEKIYTTSSVGELESSTDNTVFNFEFTRDGENLLMSGRQVIVNRKLYGAAISTHLNDKEEYSSYENSIEMMLFELEKSLERAALSKKLSAKNRELFEIYSRMDFLLKSSPAVLFNLCRKTYLKFEFVSENIEKLTGYNASELMRNEKIYPSIIHPDDIENFYSMLDVLIVQHSCVREYRLVTKFGRVVWVHDEVIAHLNEEGEITDIVGYLVDIDSQVKSHKQLQKKNVELEEAYRNIQITKDQLMQSDKLASIGQLAAGVAHEINNPVGYISSNLSTLNDYALDLIKIIETMKLKFSVDDYQNASENLLKVIDDVDYDYIKNDLPELLVQSLDGVNRVKQIVNDLKDFSHIDEEDWQLGDLHKGIDSTLNIVNNEIKYKADVVKEYGDIPEIQCIPAQLNQVFMNLLINAAHAIKTRGTIVIKTWKDGKHVMVSVSDSGHGIKKENLKRLFDPFFTTKPVGEGTGLGLSLAHGIIERHHGEIVVDSILDKGTTFTITVPIVQGEIESVNILDEEASQHE